MDTPTSLEPEAFLRALQLSDSFFPVGGYALSYGLETFAQRGLARNASHVQGILADYLAHQLSPADCVALRHAYEAAEAGDVDAAVEVDRRLSSVKVVQEFFEASARAGRRLLATVRKFLPGRSLEAFSRRVEAGGAHGHYAVVLGLACPGLGIPRDPAGLMFLYTFTVSFLGAAIRLGIINHEEAQGMLYAAQPLMVKAWRESEGRGVEDIRQFAPSLDIMGMKHKWLQTRMFLC